MLYSFGVSLFDRESANEFLNALFVVPAEGNSIGLLVLGRTTVSKASFRINDLARMLPDVTTVPIKDMHDKLAVLFR